MRCICGTGLWQ